jgi:hypothetical protein
MYENLPQTLLSFSHTGRRWRGTVTSRLLAFLTSASVPSIMHGEVHNMYGPMSSRLRGAPIANEKGPTLFSGPGKRSSCATCWWRLLRLQIGG